MANHDQPLTVRKHVLTPALALTPAAADLTDGLSDPRRFQDQIRVELARQLGTHSISLTVGNLIMVLATASIFHQTAAPEWLAVWLVVQGFNAAFHLYLGSRWVRQPVNTANAPRLLWEQTRTGLINGLLWAVAVQIFWPGSSTGERIVLYALMMGITATALHALHAHLPAYFAISLPCIGGIVLALLWHGGFDGWGYVVIMCLYIALIARFAVSLHQLLVDSLRQRFQVAELAAALRIEKDRAVNLSLSRSRFLAAASHDLRQPVHALSLFVGALKQNPTPAQSQQILQHVGGAVDAMGAMFNALLDISKLDADLLQPDWQAVDLSKLLHRIAADHTAVASSKKLDFLCALESAAGQAVYTDPILLERILHNLLSNAVRYTTHGTVAIKARVRAGRAEVLVADTGMGIARSKREQVFDEFVQLDTPGREGEQGLGLGLSIVRRLAHLLRIDLALRSRPGRGTIFALRLPLVTAPQHLVAEVHAAAAELHANGGNELDDEGIVLVIDDSIEIQLAMRALLSGWGYEVFAAENVSTLMPQVMALRQPPRLLLCDYSLRDGANGIDAIAQLHETFNYDIPAILITGDTGPERLREAVASGLPLLHKPVTQSQLREAIAKVLVD